MFISIETEDGVVLVNIDTIVYVELEREGCTIHLLSNYTIYSTEQYDTIKTKIYESFDLE